MNKTIKISLIVLFAIILTGGGVYGWNWYIQNQVIKQVDSFDECEKIKGAKITQTAPATCHLPNGRSFSEPLSDEEKIALIPIIEDQFGEWSYKQITIKDAKFSIYLPEDATIDTLEENQFGGYNQITSITVPQREKLTNQTIDLVKDKWFKLGIYVDLNLSGGSLSEQINLFAKNVSDAEPSEITKEKLTMINSNCEGYKFQIQAVSEPVYYAVKCKDSVYFLTGGQDPGTDENLAEKVVITLKEK